MAYRIEWKAQGVHIHQYGDVDIGDMTQMQREGYGDPKIDKIQYILWDGSSINSISLNPTEIRKIASQDIGASHWKKNIVHATVSKTKEVERVCREYMGILKVTVPNWKFQNFGSLCEAEDWIHSNLKS